MMCPPHEASDAILDDDRSSERCATAQAGPARRQHRRTRPDRRGCDSSSCGASSRARTDPPHVLRVTTRVTIAMKRMLQLVPQRGTRQEHQRPRRTGRRTSARPTTASRRNANSQDSRKKHSRARKNFDPFPFASRRLRPGANLYSYPLFGERGASTVVDSSQWSTMP